MKLKNKFHLCMLLTAITLLSMLIGCSVPQGSTNKSSTGQDITGGKKGVPDLSISGTSFGLCCLINNVTKEHIVVKYDPYNADYYINPYRLCISSISGDSQNSNADLSYQWEAIRVAGGFVFKCVQPKLNAYYGYQRDFYLGLTDDGESIDIYVMSFPSSYDVTSSPYINNITWVFNYAGTNNYWPYNNYYSVYNLGEYYNGSSNNLCAVPGKLEYTYNFYNSPNFQWILHWDSDE